MNKIDKYFSDLSISKKEKLAKLEGIYHEVNKKINIISRKDIDNVFLHHILPALSIAKVIQFKNKTSVLDIGSGGGLPGIPLSIIFNKVDFILVDSRKKKCEAINEVIRGLKLRNVSVKQIRSNELKEQFDYVVGRAVREPSDFMDLATKNLNDTSKKESIFYISGEACKRDIRKTAISNFFEEEYFKDKYIYVYP
jgi:16S rRNA (guanine527-N7)-methyltransferase